LGRQNQVIWRRNKVQDLLIKGHNQYLIADILKVSQTTVSCDIDNLREQARRYMQTHLQDRLLEEYENCMVGINQVLKTTWEIAIKGQGTDSPYSNSNSDCDRTLSPTLDYRTRLQH
jgi:DNA-binding CsgD family transcriptional regulator